MNLSLKSGISIFIFIIIGLHVDVIFLIIKPTNSSCQIKFIKIIILKPTAESKGCGLGWSLFWIFFEFLRSYGSK